MRCVMSPSRSAEVEPSSTGPRRTALAPLLVTLLGVVVALAGSHHGASVRGVPVFALAVVVAFLAQWVVFVPSFKAQRRPC